MQTVIEAIMGAFQGHHTPVQDYAIIRVEVQSEPGAEPEPAAVLTAAAGAAAVVAVEAGRSSLACAEEAGTSVECFLWPAHGSHHHSWWIRFHA